MTSEIVVENQVNIVPLLDDGIAKMEQKEPDVVAAPTMDVIPEQFANTASLVVQKQPTDIMVQPAAPPATDTMVQPINLPPEVAMNPAPAEMPIPEIKPKKAPKSRRPCSCAECMESVHAVVQPKIPRRVTRKSIDLLVKQRRRGMPLGHPLGNFFCCAKKSVINRHGDMRYENCVLNSQMGPYLPGENVAVIDWLSSANLVLMTRSGRATETVPLALMSPALVTQDMLKYPN